MIRQYQKDRQIAADCIHRPKGRPRKVAQAKKENGITRSCSCDTDAGAAKFSVEVGKPNA